MSIEKQYRRPNLKSEYLFYFNSDEMEANILFVKEKKIERLMLISNEGGFNINNIDFLKELPFIKELHMGACDKIENFDGLTFLKELETLVFSPGKKNIVDVSNLIKLNDLGFSYSKKIIGLDKLINLKILRVSNATNDYFQLGIFKNYSKLKELSIGSSIIENGFSFLKENKNLESLVITHAKRAFSIKGIELLKENLKVLNFSSSKKIENIELVSKLINLESLGFIESVKLESAKILEPLKKMKAFGIYGSSSFIDGDLTTLKQMRDTIKHFKVQNKRHYFYE